MWKGTLRVRRTIPRSGVASERGFALLLIVLSFLAIGATLLFAGLGAGGARTEQRIARAAASESQLNDIRQILIAYVISPPNTVARPSSSIRPGTLPTPDSLANSNYDGTEDNSCLGSTINGLPGVGSASTTKRCLGKFPWKTIAIDVGPGEAHDPTGRVPWLAVSANLAFYDACLLVLNSDVAKLASPGTSTCTTPALPYPQPTTLPQPWLKVYDHNGAVLSDRVAAVLILPGPPLITETRAQGARTVSTPGNPSDYLDSVNLPLGCSSGCTVYDNAGLNNEFVMIPAGTLYPSDAQTAVKRGEPVPFNDVLVYLTVDEIMHHAGKRVAGEMAKALKTFTTDATTGFTKYPWLQSLSTAYADSSSLHSQKDMVRNAFPIFGAFPFMVDDIEAKFRSDFSWVLAGSTESTGWESTATPPTGAISAACYRFATGPNRWIRNPLIGTLNASTTYGGPFTFGSAPTASGVCKWLGGTKVECEYNAGSTTSSFIPYLSLATCNSQTSPGAAVTLVATRKITIINATSDCSVAPIITYAAASGADVHRWSWKCNNSNAPDILAVKDTISDPALASTGLPRVATLVTQGPAQTFDLLGMRYHPIMPTWFFHNRWYSTAFAAWAPGSTKLPSSLTPTQNACNPETSLKVGGATVSNGVIMMAGSSLTGQTRPAATITSYLEADNATGETTCVLKNSEAPASSTLNDSLMVLSP